LSGRVRIERTPVRGYGAEGRRCGPDFTLQASNGKTYKVSDFAYFMISVDPFDEFGVSMRRQ
jgi:hypothetical protein